MMQLQTILNSCIVTPLLSSCLADLVFFQPITSVQLPDVQKTVLEIPIQFLYLLYIVSPVSLASIKKSCRTRFLLSSILNNFP